MTGRVLQKQRTVVALGPSFVQIRAEVKSRAAYTDALLKLAHSLVAFLGNQPLVVVDRSGAPRLAISTRGQLQRVW